ncbi:MAG: hypothetical protein ACI4I2_02935 [Oscillospiraceae bacterium]
MNNISKRIVSAFAAVVTAAAMSVTAFAADYGSAPSYPNTPSTDTSATKEEVDKSIEDAIKDVKGEGTAKVEVENTNKLVLTAATLKKLAKADGTLEIASPKMTLTIDASTIKNATRLNLSASVKNSKSSTTVKFASKAKFGCEVKVAVTSCKMSKKALEKAHVYVTKKDPKTGKTVTTDLGPVEVNEDGVPVITVTQGGEYTIK